MKKSKRISSKKTKRERSKTKKYFFYALAVLILALFVFIFYARPWEPKPEADFSYWVLDAINIEVKSKAETCYIPCKVFLSDRSTKAKKLIWKIHDTIIKDNPEPYYVFMAPGKQKISLTAINGKNEEVMNKYIDIKAPPFAAFEIINNGCTAPCEIEFKNNSENGSKYTWNLSGVTVSNNKVKDPGAIQYPNDGKFNVRLIVENEDGIKADTIQEVTILRDNTPFADFNFKRLTKPSVSKQKFKFTSTSKNAVAYKWDFGDGTPPVTDENPSHTFNGYGTYPVTLTVRGPGNTTNETFKNVKVNNLNFEINFDYERNIRDIRNGVNFKNLNLNPNSN